ncbi:nucleoid-associated protein [Pedobacter gandavensis]|uniref:Nucleoid-associated protein n=1 Tax=Pedobacter gandavensis TaxID=2679963 RepID=A0ABR6EV54_9SPHI|nr:nucleoid-associated protein [Pedobacter gandavensis]MBB2149153.1 nucleoid-associated protein [Pedobacter gandavensis]
MISFFEASLSSLSVHRVGNKCMDEFYFLSEAPIPVTPEQSGHLMSYFLSPFQKVNETFNFYHPSDLLEMNEVYNYAKDIFKSIGNMGELHSISKNLAVLLYEISSHPKIKSGELYIAQFENVQMEGELFSAIGIFKSETKETYLTVNPNREGFDLSFEPNAINMDRLDKGCLIFNSDTEKGFKVVCIDQSSAKDSRFWKDDYLQLKVVNNRYHQTESILQICKNFVINKLDEDFDISKADKIDLLNRSLKYFKEKESFDLEEFTNEVICSSDAIELFKSYKKTTESDFDLSIPDTFEISDQAVKKQAKSYKSTIKLDKNFQINISGNKDLIEKGFDDDKGMNFYKVYFSEEV